MPKKVSTLAKTEKRIEAEERKIEKEEKFIVKEAKTLRKEEAKIEDLEKKILFKIGKFKVTKKHVFNLAKICGGALLGTGFGLNFIDTTAGAVLSLSWLKVLAITALSIVFAYLLVYKEEKAQIKLSKNPVWYLSKHVITIYAISFGIVAVASVFFTAELPHLDILAKALLVGSFSAVSGAITFDLL